MLESALGTAIDMERPVTGELIKDIAKIIYPYDYSVSGRGSEKALSAYRKLANFKVHRFESGKRLRGWEIPPGWRANKAIIKHKGRVIYDCLASGPLGCAYFSPSFEGTVSKKELMKHTAWREDLPESIVYDWTRLYRPAERNKWGLCIPWKELFILPDTDLEITIHTETYQSAMYVLDLRIQGEVNDEIIINSHNCHPFQANDDISGCAVGLALFKHAFLRKRNYYSYRLLIGPELYGPMFWLEEIWQEKTRISSVVLLKSVGNDSPIKIQNSFLGNHDINNIAKAAMQTNHAWQQDASFYPYRSYYGNDETIFEAPGYEIPTITLTRYPFKEYHTNLDIPERLNPGRLLECYKMLCTIVDIAETNMRAKSVQPGLFCLSSPRYNLYQKATEPGISNDGNSIMEKKWNLLMNCLSRELSSGLSILDLSLKYQLPYRLVLEYVSKWESAGLVRMEREKL